MRSNKWLTVSFLILLAGVLQPSAYAHGRIAIGVGIGVPVVPYYQPFYPGYPWWTAYPYPYPGPGYYGPRVVEVRRINYGTIQFNVKPENTRVYVDGKYLGTVEALEGHHHEANLGGGDHTVRLVAADGRHVERTVYVAIGKKTKISEKL
jgi:hypothetical protein